MSWQTPKTNWGVDAVNTADFNRIEGNIETLHKGNGQSSLVTIGTVSGGQLDINETDETFVVTFVNNVTLIKSTNRQPGNRIQLINTGSGFYIQTGGTPSGDYRPIRIVNEAIEHQIYMYETVSLIYDGSYWYLSILRN